MVLVTSRALLNDTTLKIIIYSQRISFSRNNMCFLVALVTYLRQLTQQKSCELIHSDTILVRLSLQIAHSNFYI